MNTGTWNVLTLLKPGKMQELAEQIKRIKLDVVAIHEIRWSGTGLIQKKDFSFYYSGANNNTGQAGTGFLIQKKMQKFTMSFMPRNERLCKLRLKGKFNNISLISVYAPMEDKVDEIKEQFYEDLQKVVDNTPKTDTIIILGDLNARLGKEDTYTGVTGQYTLHQNTSGNGEMLCEFAVLNNMTIMSTQFQHKLIHKGTWISSDEKTVNQIDHVTTNSSKELTEDVKIDERAEY
jgi:exonuclease III